MREIMNKTLSSFVLALASSLMLVSPTLAQEEEVCREIVDLVERGVPKEIGDPAFLKKLLEPSVGPQFADRFLGLAQQAALPAVQSKLRLSQRQCVPDQEGHRTCRLSNFRKTELLKFDERQGKAAYLNLTREWDPKLGENKLPDGQAMELARGVIKSWGIPDEELALQLADLKHLNIAGGPKLDAKPAEFLSTEVHVRFPRQIGGVPVFDSYAQLAFDVRGQVARMRIFWPSFGLVPGLEPNPLPREELVMRTAEELSDGAVCGSIREGGGTHRLRAVQGGRDSRPDGRGEPGRGGGRLRISGVRPCARGVRLPQGPEGGLRASSCPRDARWWPDSSIRATTENT